jgi:hypothetical protein
MRFAVFLQTATKKIANGNHHAMLKVIQHGMTIAKYWSGCPAWMGINNKIASVGGDDLFDMYYIQSHSQQRHCRGLGILIPSF